jgi:hypothetical protein
MQEISRVVGAIEPQGSFYSSGTLTKSVPTLTVKGLGSIRFPVSPKTARQIIGQAEQAPYGRGEDTLLDTRIRNTWQLDPTKFSVSGVEWATQFEALLQRVAHDLGLGEVAIEAHLYKLLVYDKGGFFVSHRDTEKVPNMFATLSVILPSAHTGGEIVIEHEGSVVRRRFGGQKSAESSKFIAFYADCRHEVKPVTQGFRVVLVYNLAMPSAPRKRAADAPLAKALAVGMMQWPGHVSKQVVLLDHCYSEANLSFANLKNRDRQVTDIILGAAERADCEVYLALTSRHQMISGDVPYRRTSRYGRWGRYRDNSEDDNVDPEEFDAYDVIEDDIELKHFIDTNGRKAKFDALPLSSEEVAGGKSLDEMATESVSVTEATGNEGATMDKWYHGAAVVFWPRSRRYEVVCQGDRTANVRALLDRLKRASARGLTPAKRRDAVMLAEALIEQWGQCKKGEPRDSLILLESLALLGDEALAERGVRIALAAGADAGYGPPLAEMCRIFGWHRWFQLVWSVLEPLMSNDLPPCLHVLEDLREADDAFATSSEGQNFARRLLDEFLDYSANPRRRGWRTCPQVALAAALRLVCHRSSDTELTRLCQGLERHRDVYDVCTAVTPKLLELRSWGNLLPERRKALAQVAEFIKAALEASLAQIPERPKDWARDANGLTCACDYCAELRIFLKDSNRSELHLPAAKERRAHLHQTIDSLCLDVTHDTLRQGRPFVLICRKTEGSYERRVARRKVEQTCVSRLKAYLQ